MQYRVCAIKSKNVMKFDVIQKHLYHRTINICDFYQESNFKHETIFAVYKVNLYKLVIIV